VVIFDAVGLGLADVIGESVELAFHDGIVPAQNIRQRRNRRIRRMVARHFGEFVAQRQPQLEFEVVVHGSAYSPRTADGPTAIAGSIARVNFGRAAFVA
jgi:hypothetical protein